MNFTYALTDLNYDALHCEIFRHEPTELCVRMPTVERAGPIDFEKFGIPKPLPTLYVITEQGKDAAFIPSSTKEAYGMECKADIFSKQRSAFELAHALQRLRKILPKEYTNLHAIVHQSQEAFFQDIAKELRWNAKKVR